MAAAGSAEKLLSFPFRQVANGEARSLGVMAIGSPPISFSSPKCSSLSYPFEQMGMDLQNQKKTPNTFCNPTLETLKNLGTHFDPLANPFWRPLAPARALSRARLGCRRWRAPRWGALRGWGFWSPPPERLSGARREASVGCGSFFWTWVFTGYFCGCLRETQGKPHGFVCCPSFFSVCFPGGPWFS